MDSQKTDTLYEWKYVNEKLSGLLIIGMIVFYPAILITVQIIFQANIDQTHWGSLTQKCAFG